MRSRDGISHTSSGNVLQQSLFQSEQNPYSHPGSGISISQGPPIGHVQPAMAIVNRSTVTASNSMRSELGGTGAAAFYPSGTAQGPTRGTISQSNNPLGSDIHRSRSDPNNMGLLHQHRPLSRNPP